MMHSNHIHGILMVSPCTNVLLNLPSGLLGASGRPFTLEVDPK